MEHGSRCSAAEDSRDEQTIFTAMKEDLEQNTADIPVVMQRQVLVIQKAQRTVDIPLLQYIDTTADVPVAKALQKTARGLHNEVQRNQDRREAAFSIAQDQEQEADCHRQ